MTTVDEGWSWIILGASFGCSFLLFGTIASGGILYGAILENFDSSYLEATWVFFSMQICLNLMGPVSGYLGQRFSYRAVVMSGGLLACFGLIGCYFVQTVYPLYVSFGLVYGVGAGLVVTPHVVVVNLAFDKYRALANGIFSAGASLGSFSVPPAVEVLIEKYFLNGFFLIWAAVILHLCVFGAVYRQNIKKCKQITHVTQQKLIQDNSVTEKFEKNEPITSNCKQNETISGWFSFLSKFHFWIAALGWSMTVFSISCFAVTIPNFAIEQNKSISRWDASLLMSCWAIGDLMGRLVCGWLIDRKWIKLENIYLVTMTAAAVSSTCTQFFSSYAGLASCSFFFGTFLGSSFIQHPLLLIKFLGVDIFQRAMGYLNISAGISLIGFTMLVGILRDETKSYHMNFTLIGITLIFPVQLWIIERAKNFFCRSKDTHSI